MVVVPDMLFNPGTIVGVKDSTVVDPLMTAVERLVLEGLGGTLPFVGMGNHATPEGPTTMVADDGAPLSWVVTVVVPVTLDRPGKVVGVRVSTAVDPPLVIVTRLVPDGAAPPPPPTEVPAGMLAGAVGQLFAVGWTLYPPQPMVAEPDMVVERRGTLVPPQLQ